MITAINTNYYRGQPTYKSNRSAQDKEQAYSMGRLSASLEQKKQENEQQANMNMIQNVMLQAKEQSIDAKIGELSRAMEMLNMKLQNMPQLNMGYPENAPPPLEMGYPENAPPPLNMPPPEQVAIPANAPPPLY